MKKLHSIAFYALVTPAMTLGAGSVLAQTSADQELDREQQSAEHIQSDMEHQGYMASAPANGLQASTLIGAEVITTGDEVVGSVSDLIIDQDGQLIAIVVGVGGFLGMGERDVAIGWADVSRSGTSDEPGLRINATREDLSSAPGFESTD